MKKIIGLLLVLSMMLSLTGCGNKSYKEGVEALENGDYLKAIELLSEKPDYKDAAEKIKKARKAQLQIYADSIDLTGAQVLLTNLPDGEVEEYKDLVFALVKNGIAERYHGKYAGYADVCNFCAYAADMVSIIGLGSTVQADALYEVTYTIDSIQKYDTFLSWYPGQNSKINSYISEINRILDFKELYQPGYDLYTYADLMLNEYSSDSLSASVLLALRNMGDYVMKTSQSQSEAEFSENIVTANEYYDEFKNTVNDAITKVAENQFVLNNLNEAFSLSYQW